MAGLAVILVRTNPSMDDYRNYISRQVLKESQKSGRDGFERFIGPLAGGIAGSLAASQTIRTDYGVLSTYELPLGESRLRLVGIFKNFIVLETPNQK